MNLIQVLRQMSEPLPTHRPQVHLGSSGEMYVPEFRIAGYFSSASQLVGRRAQEVTSDDVPERPSAAAVFGDADLEFTAWFFFFPFACYVAERVDGEVFVQVRTQVDQAWNGIEM